MNHFLLFLSVVFPFLYPIVPPKPEQKELIVFATGNLKDQLDSIGHFFERSNPGWKVKYRFGPSDELTSLADGRVPVDVLIITDPENIKSLQDQKFISEQNAMPFLTDKAVIVTQAETEYAPKEIKDLVTGDEVKQFALSGEKTPLGIAARAYIKKLGMETIPPEKLIAVKTPRAAVNSVKTGEAKWTICYGTDAAEATKKLKVLFPIPSSDIPSVDYYAVIPKASKHPDAGHRYLEALQSTISRKMFENAGFILKLPPLPPPTQTAPKEKKKKEKD